MRNSPQHSPMLGQAASSQIVFRPCSRIRRFRPLKCGPWLSGTLSQLGFAPIVGGAVSGESGSVRRGGRGSIATNGTVTQRAREVSGINTLFPRWNPGERHQ